MFVFGGKDKSGGVLGDTWFLCPNQQHWTEVCYTTHTHVHTHTDHEFCNQNTHVASTFTIFNYNESAFEKSINVTYCFTLQFPIEGTVPEPRHSHTACSYQGGAVVFGGLNKRGAPLGDAVLLRPHGSGFTWETLELQPPPVPRSVMDQLDTFYWYRSIYSHTSPSGYQGTVTAPRPGDG